MLSNLKNRTPEQIIRDKELQDLLKKSAEAFAAMSPAEQEAMFKAQRESMARSALPYGHNQSLEWCEAELLKVEQQIADAPHWGGHLTALDECQRELKTSIRQKRQAAQSSE